MEKLNRVAKGLGIPKGKIKKLIKKGEIYSEFIDGVCYVDLNEVTSKVNLDKNKITFVFTNSIETIDNLSMIMGCRKGKIRDLIKTKKLSHTYFDKKLYVYTSDITNKVFVEDLFGKNPSYIDILFGTFYSIGKKRLQNLIDNGVIDDKPNQIDFEFLSNLHHQIQLHFVNTKSKNNIIVPIQKNSVLLILDGIHHHIS